MRCLICWNAWERLGMYGGQESWKCGLVRKHCWGGVVGWWVGQGIVVGLCPHPGQGRGWCWSRVHWVLGAKWCGGAVPGERIRPCWRLWIGVIAGFTKCSKHSSVTRHAWLKCINNTPPGLDFQFQISLLKKYFWFIWNESLSFYQPQSKFARLENVNDQTNSRDG